MALSNKRVVLNITGVAIILLLVLLAQAVWSEEEENAYMKSYTGADAERIGSDKCLMCHKDRAPGEDEVTHVSIIDSDEENPDYGFSCEACHGPGSKHNGVATGILSFGKMPSEKVTEICTRCHEEKDSFKLDSWKDGKHNVGEISCATCHSGHSDYESFLVKETVVALCSTCHADKADAFEKGEHGANDAGLTCSDCHNPHN